MYPSILIFIFGACATCSYQLMLKSVSSVSFTVFLASVHLILYMTGDSKDSKQSSVHEEEENEEQDWDAVPRRSTRVLPPKKVVEVDNSATPTKRGGKRGSVGRKASPKSKRAKKVPAAIPPTTAINWVQCDIGSCGKWRIVSDEKFVVYSAPNAKVTCSLIGVSCDVPDDETRFADLAAQTTYAIGLKAKPVIPAPRPVLTTVAPVAPKAADASPKMIPAAAPMAPKPISASSPRNAPAPKPVAASSPRNAPLAPKPMIPVAPAPVAAPKPVAPAGSSSPKTMAPVAPKQVAPVAPAAGSSSPRTIAPIAPTPAAPVAPAFGSSSPKTMAPVAPNTVAPVAPAAGSSSPKTMAPVAPKPVAPVASAAGSSSPKTVAPVAPRPMIPVAPVAPKQTVPVAPAGSSSPKTVASVAPAGSSSPKTVAPVARPYVPAVTGFNSFLPKPVIPVQAPVKPFVPTSAPFSTGLFGQVGNPSPSHGPAAPPKPFMPAESSSPSMRPAGMHVSPFTIGGPSGSSPKNTFVPANTWIKPNPGAASPGMKPTVTVTPLAHPAQPAFRPMGGMPPHNDRSF